MQWFRAGLVFKALRLLYQSTLGLRVIKKRRRRLAVCVASLIGRSPYFRQGLAFRVQGVYPAHVEGEKAAVEREDAPLLRRQLVLHLNTQMSTFLRRQLILHLHIQKSIFPSTYPTWTLKCQHSTPTVSLKPDSQICQLPSASKHSTPSVSLKPGSAICAWARRVSTVRFFGPQKEMKLLSGRQSGSELNCRVVGQLFEMKGQERRPPA